MVQMLKDKAAWDKCHADAGDKTVIVDFTASWCGPCKMIGPEFEKFSKEYPSIIFVKVDVDENDEVAQVCGISAMPTFHVYQQGKKVEEMVGADKRKLEEMIKKYNKK